MTVRESDKILVIWLIADGVFCFLFDKLSQESNKITIYCE